jgi:hypothetical protein
MDNLKDGMMNFAKINKAKKENISQEKWISFQINIFLFGGVMDWVFFFINSLVFKRKELW